MAQIDVILLYGAISGGIYGLLALGFTLIYGVSRLVNLAHGAFFMLGAYAYFVFRSAIGPFLLLLGFSSQLGISIFSVVLASVFVAVIGSIVFRLTIHPVIDDEVAVLVVTVALALIFQQIILLGFGTSYASIPPLLPGSIAILGVLTTYSLLLAFAVSLGLFASLLILITKSKIGRAMRALSQDREAAMLMGINTERLYMLTMAISAALGALAGIFIASSTTGVADPFMWLNPLAMSFSIVILGGLGSIKGTFIGGFIIGYAQIAFTILVPQGGMIGLAVPFAIMVLILFLRPKGLFGKRIEMEE